MEMLNEYLVVIVMLTCLLVGYVIKHLVDSPKVNKFIPLIMAVLGVVMNAWLNGFGTFTPEILLGGMASGLASTGMHQAFKQFLEGKDGEQ
jgi:hypothetical protein